MEVWLVGVGRNLNRSVRTCASFGVQDLYLLRCDGWRIRGNLYSATGRVHIHEESSSPPKAGTLAFETTYTTLIADIDWNEIKRIVVGGETCGVKGVDAEYKALIPCGPPSLTVEAALAVILYEWSSHVTQICSGRCTRCRTYLTGQKAKRITKGTQ